MVIAGDMLTDELISYSYVTQILISLMMISMVLSVCTFKSICKPYFGGVR